MNTATEKGPAPEHVLATPLWVQIIRGLQFVISVVVVGLAGYLVSLAPLDEWGLAVATGVITWLVVAYTILTEKIPVLQVAYNIIAVLVLDGFLVILWLATFAASAAERAQWKVFSYSSGFNDFDLSSDDLDFDFDSFDFDDSTLDDSGSLGRRALSHLAKRADGAQNVLDMFSAVAGLGALVWLLFIATFVWSVISFLAARRQGRFQSFFGTSTAASPENGVQLEPKAQPVVSVAHAPGPVHDQQQQQQQQVPVQYAPPAGSYPVEVYTPPEQYAQAPYQPTGGYPAPSYPQQPYPAPSTVSPSISPPPQDPNVQGQYPPNAYYPQQPQQPQQ